MICSQVTIEEPGTGKQYDCINGVCVESSGGKYTEPTCAGACKKKDDNGSYIIMGVGILALAWLLGGKK